ncbi:MAG: hypothetical protein II411_04365 [Lachnospiraceae bacterium]|nr:hypothetical protein [Lachnospiraceae bacterium]
MGRRKGLSFTLFAALTALTGYAAYMAKKDEFSDETKDRYDSVVDKIKNVGTDIKRTYTSIGDKKEFTASTKYLSESAKNLAKNTGNLVVSASSDMFKFAKNSVRQAVDNFSDDDSVGDYDDLDESYVKKSKPKNTKQKNSTKKSVKKNSKKK